MRRATVVMLLLSSSCFSSLVDSTKVDCETSEHCPSDHFCDRLTSKCKEGEEDLSCARDVDCPLGQICRADACVLGCREDGDCGQSAACIDGGCSTRAGACNTDASCAFGERCDLAMRSCVRHVDAALLCSRCPLNRECLDDSECAPGDRCDRPDPEFLGRCKGCEPCHALGSSSPCGGDGDCVNGELCHRSPCFDDEGCVEGACTEPPNTEGGGNATPNLRSCNRGYCAQPAVCGSLSCDPSAGQGPVEGACPRGYECYDVLDSQQPGSCTSDQDCAAGGRCRRINELDATMFCSCTNDADCASNAECSDTGWCIDYHVCLQKLGLTCDEVRP